MPMTTDGLIGGGLTVGGSVRPAQCRQVLQREGGGGCATANPARRDRGVCLRAASLSRHADFGSRPQPLWICPRARACRHASRAERGRWRTPWGPQRLNPKRGSPARTQCRHGHGLAGASGGAWLTGLAAWQP